jgi:hypothetical protein
LGLLDILRIQLQCQMRTLELCNLTKVVTFISVHYIRVDLNHLCVTTMSRDLIFRLLQNLLLADDIILFKALK